MIFCLRVSSFFYAFLFFQIPKSSRENVIPRWLGDGARFVLPNVRDASFPVMYLNILPIFLSSSDLLLRTWEFLAFVTIQLSFFSFPGIRFLPVILCTVRAIHFLKNSSLLSPEFLPPRCRIPTTLFVFSMASYHFSRNSYIVFHDSLFFTLNLMQFSRPLFYFPPPRFCLIPPFTLNSGSSFPIVNDYFFLFIEVLNHHLQEPSRTNEGFPGLALFFLCRAIVSVRYLLTNPRAIVFSLFQEENHSHFSPPRQTSLFRAPPFYLESVSPIWVPYMLFSL